MIYPEEGREGGKKEGRRKRWKEKKEEGYCNMEHNFKTFSNVNI